MVCGEEGECVLSISRHDIRSCAVVDQLKALNSVKTTLKSCAGITLVCIQIIGRRRQGIRVRLTLVERSIKHPDMTCTSCAAKG